VNLDRPGRRSRGSKLRHSAAACPRSAPTVTIGASMTTPPPVPQAAAALASTASLFDALTARGFVQDATPALAERLRAGPITAYVGFDPTADSLHVGSLVPIMGLAWLQRFGHTPIVLVGGVTAMIGDPSGKRAERPMLAAEQVGRNAESIARQLARFLSFEGPAAARLRNNADWLHTLSLIDFLRDAGKHFTLSYMLQKESVRSRLDTGISYTEFSYMLVQAYDFWHLFHTEHCELQMGGSDQWGNITAGIELIGRREGKPAHGVVFPLVTTSGGAKFGKTEAGNIWLDPARTTPYQFYQFWINTDDRDIERYLKLFTFLPLAEIAELMRQQSADPGQRPAQRRLAEEITNQVHGEDAAQQAIEASRALFGGSSAAVAALGDEMPTCRIPAAQLASGLSLVDALIQTGLAKSKAEARRGIEGRGFYINDEQVSTVDRRLTEADLQLHEGDKFVLLRKGKKTYVKLLAT
jgi:tyrosyl-tRNA synthetase